MKNTLKIKKNYYVIISIIILTSTIFMSIGYASINSIILDITGTASATAQGGVFITNVEYVSNNNADISSSTINNYYKTVLDSTIVLGTSISSNITYKVTLYNNSNKDYAFIGTVYADNFYDNSNIQFELNGLEKNDIIKANGGSITFSITFSYAGTTTENNILNSYLNFKFGTPYTVTYLNFDENSYPSTVINETTYTNTFTSSPSIVSVMMNETLLTTNQFTYSNGTLTIPNVTGDLVIISGTYVTVSTQSDLSNAITNLTKDGGAIVFEQDITLSDNSSLAFNSGGNVILDLNKNTLSTKNLSDGEKLIVVSENTNLTIKGSNSTILSNEIGIYMDNTFIGELRLEGINLKIDYNTSDSTSGDCAIRNAGTGKVYVIDSTIESIRWAGVNNTAGGYVYIKNSTIIGDNYSLKNEGNNSTMEVVSGTFIANKLYTTSGQAVYNSNGSITVLAGTFNDTSFINFMASGKTYSQNDEGNYIVQ